MFNSRLEKQLKELEEKYQYTDTFYQYLKTFAKEKLNEKEESKINNNLDSCLDELQDLIWDCFDDIPKLVYLQARLEDFLDVVNNYYEIAED